MRRAVLAATLASLTLLSGAVTAPAVALNDPLYDRQWGLAAIGAKSAWDRGILGHGVEIAVVDSGAHLTHQDLVANLRPGLNLVDRSRPPQDDHCENDDCGHGTHVTGIAAASIDDGGAVGVAPRSGIVPVKVLSASGSGSWSAVAEGIRWAADRGVEVINLSLGAELPISGTPSDVVSAVRYAWSKGSICVFAAGNSFIFSAEFSDEPAMVVSATNRRNTKADFSNGVGDARWGIAAPGGGDTIQFAEDENIWSTAWDPSGANDTYTEKRGTSMAAPFVSGAAALLRSAGLSPQATVDRLLSTATDLGPSGRDSTYGAGLVNVDAATKGLAGPGGGAVVAPTTTAPPKATTTTARTAPPPTTARRAASPTTSPPPPASGGAPATTATSTTEAVPPGTSPSAFDDGFGSAGDGGDAGDLARGPSQSDPSDGLPVVPVLVAAAAVLATGGVAMARAWPGRLPWRSG